MSDSGSKIIAAGMRAFLVVHGHRFLESLFDLLDIPETAIQIELRFYNPIYPFRNCIFIRITRGGHTDQDAVLLKQVDILLAGVLFPPIRMMDQSRFLVAAILQRHSQRPERSFRLQGGMYLVAMIFFEYWSVTSETYTNPVSVGTKVMSLAHICSGPLASYPFIIFGYFRYPSLESVVLIRRRRGFTSNSFVRSKE